MRCGVRAGYSRECHNGVTEFMNVWDFRYFFLFTYMYVMWWIDYILPVIRFYCSIRYRNHPVSSPIRHLYGSWTKPQDISCPTPTCIFGSWTHPKSSPVQHLYPVAEPPSPIPGPLLPTHLTLHGSCSQDPPTYSPTRHLSPTGGFFMLTPPFKPPHPFFSLGD